jgi:hypothetical protein
VDHLVGVAVIGEACRHPISSIARSQQHRPDIRRHRPAVERRHHTPAIEDLEFQLLGGTLCRHGPRTGFWQPFVAK